MQKLCELAGNAQLKEVHNYTGIALGGIEAYKAV